MNPETVLRRLRTLPTAIAGLSFKISAMSQQILDDSDSDADVRLLRKQIEAHMNYRASLEQQKQELMYRYCTECGTELVNVGRSRDCRVCLQCANEESEASIE